MKYSVLQKQDKNPPLSRSYDSQEQHFLNQIFYYNFQVESKMQEARKATILLPTWRRRGISTERSTHQRIGDDQEPIVTYCASNRAFETRVQYATGKEQNTDTRRVKNIVI